MMCIKGIQRIVYLFAIPNFAIANQTGLTKSLWTVSEIVSSTTKGFSIRFCAIIKLFSKVVRDRATFRRIVMFKNLILKLASYNEKESS